MHSLIHQSGHQGGSPLWLTVPKSATTVP
jgi:hypothetical protein